MTAAKGRSDPRASLPTAAREDVRPVVALPRAGVPTWVLILIAVLAGLLLFSVLESRRGADTAPSVRARGADAIAPAAAPPLYVPPVLQQAPPLQPVPRARAYPSPALTAAAAPAAPPQAQPRAMYVPQPVPAPQVYAPPAPPPRVHGEPALVLDAGSAAAPAQASQGGGETRIAAGGSSDPAGTAVAGTRTRAGMLANRANTVPQGTLIPAVLETALNSTRPGLARAIVSHDVRGFDGNRILIPRGSRLIGEYRSDAQPGQRRALVNWFRLIRPDGATIAIGSPAGDPLGRGGIRARVDNDFLGRFLGGVLQSAVNVGVSLAAAQARGPVVVLPGAVQGGGPTLQRQRRARTLTVPHGTSISIFTARDLDFTDVDRAQ